MNSQIISDDNLGEHLSESSTVDRLVALFKQQISDWDLANRNYEHLKSIKKKHFPFKNTNIKIQFNSGRITSSTAKVDAQSIKKRKCFLCNNNLPSEQKGLLFNEKYLLLVNPFPIFEEHFTIPLLEHQKQEILPHFVDLLEITKELGERYTLFYNGPKCGASAPDHMHFQACPNGSIPAESEINLLKNDKNKLVSKEKVEVFAISEYLRNLFVIESSDRKLAVQEFEKLYDFMKTETNSAEEPLMNIIVSYNEKWKILVFPRKAHRPKQFFEEGSSKILLSPAAVDFGGLLITPREEDFYKLTANDIEDIFEQTTIDIKIFKRIIEQYN